MSKQQELLRPSLEKGWKETKSYDIDRFFLVAFFGGTIPMMVLGTRNAKWLNVPKKTIQLLLAVGVLFTIAGIGLSYLAVGGNFSRETNQYIKFGVRALAVILFFVYRQALKKPYQQHQVTNGEITKLLKPALLWILLGGLIQFVILISIYVGVNW